MELWRWKGSEIARAVRTGQISSREAVSACGMGLEGIISKRRDCPYRAGRVIDWLKAKCTHRQEFVIAGYLPRSDNARAVGALAAGYFAEGELTYVGRVGTGFTANVARALWTTMQPLRSKGPPFAKPLPAADRKGVVWVRPELVAANLRIAAGRSSAASPSPQSQPSAFDAVATSGACWT